MILSREKRKGKEMEENQCRVEGNGVEGKLMKGSRVTGKERQGKV